MFENTSTKTSSEEHKIKLQALRKKLQAGEDSPTIENFDGDRFIVLMHEKYAGS